MLSPVAKPKNGSFKNLYEFWDNRITKLINKDLAEAEGDTVINLASKEYFHVVKPDKLKGKLIHVHFKEKRGDTFKVIAFNAKKARGAMAKQIVNYKIVDPEHLKSLEVNGYIFHTDKSDEANYMFIKE